MRIITKILLVFYAVNLAPYTYASDIQQYTNVHEVGFFVLGKDMQWKEVTDTLNIIHNKENIEFSLNITVPNLHSCQMQGVANKVDDYYEYKETMSIYSIEEKGMIDAECILQLHFFGNEVTLKDKNLICRKNYCGARGGIDGTTFNKK